MEFMNREISRRFLIGFMVILACGAFATPFLIAEANVIVQITGFIGSVRGI